MCRRWSASITASLSHCAISRCMGSSLIGPPSSTISIAIGRPMRDIYVDFVRDGVCGNGAARMGNSRWRRLTEVRAGSAKSVFHFDVQGSVAKSTHARIPWLRFIRQRSAPASISGRSTAGTFQRRSRYRRGLSRPVAPRLSERRPHRRSTRRVLYRALAVGR